jgi:hypothetical protein
MYASRIFNPQCTVEYVNPQSLDATYTSTFNHPYKEAVQAKFV